MTRNLMNTNLLINIKDRTYIYFRRIIYIFFIFPNFLFSQNNGEELFRKLSRRPSLAAEMNRKLDKLEKDTTNYKNFHYVKVGNLSRIQKDKKLKIHIYSKEKTMLFTAKRIEAYSLENYTWYGENEDGFASITIINKDGVIFGYMKIYDEVSEIYGLSNEFSMILDKKPTRNSPCNSQKDSRSGIFNDSSSSMLSTRSTCSASKIKVLFVTTPAGRAAVPDINQTALTCIQQFNNALSASAITDIKSKLVFAGIQHLNSFTEEATNPEGDLDRLKIVSSSMRESTQADIVVLLAQANYQAGGRSIDGRVKQVEATDNMAFALMKANKATNSNFTFSHEIGHIFGGVHRDDPANTFAHGHSFFVPGVNVIFTFGPSGNYQTIMSVDALTVPVIDKFSNPNNTLYGTPSGTNNRDVARKIKERTNTVALFRNAESDLEMNIVGDIYLTPYAESFFEAIVNCGLSPFQFTWELSEDGFNYIVNSSGSSNSTSFVYDPSVANWSYLRVTVTDAQGKSKILIIGLSAFNDDYLKKNTNNDVLPVQLSKGKPTLFPNPTSRDEFFIEYEVDGYDKEVLMEMINSKGEVVSRISKRSIHKGIFKEKIETKNISSGFYIVKTIIDGLTSFQNVIISK